MNVKTAAMQLTTGQIILTEVLDETETMAIIKNPLEVRIGHDAKGMATFNFVRYMPFDEGNVCVYSRNVVSLSLLNEDFETFYYKKVDSFKKLQEEAEAKREKDYDSISDFLKNLTKKDFH